jgi:hypothetical protein
MDPQGRSDTTFRDRGWAERVKHLGDEAEAVYELDRTNRKIRFTRNGINRPPFTGREINLLPEWVKHGPDYIESWKGKPRFVEVQGIGRDQVFKLKDEKHQALAFCDNDMGVHLFIWNNVSRRYILLPLVQVSLMVLAASQAGDVGVFDPEGRPKPYTRLTWSKLTANVETHRIAPSRGA